MGDDMKTPTISPRDESIATKERDDAESSTVSIFRTGDDVVNAESIENPDIFGAESLRNGSGDKRRIGEILLQSGSLSSTDLEKIEQLQREYGLKFGEAAERLGLITQKDVQYALASQFDFPAVRAEESAFDKELHAALQPFSEQSERMRKLRSEIQLRWLNKGNRVLAVVSPGQGDGKTYLTANLGVVFSQLGKRTLLIDANLRSPRLHKVFGTVDYPGLSTILAGNVTKQDLEHLPECPPFMTHLAVLSSGVIPPNPTELLSRGGFALILNRLRQYYDVIIIDTPPATHTADVQAIVASSDGALIVARQDESKINDVKALSERIKHLDKTIVGAVVNKQ